MAVMNVSPVVSTDQVQITQLMKERNGTIQLCVGLDVPASCIEPMKDHLLKYQ